MLHKLMCNKHSLQLSGGGDLRIAFYLRRQHSSALKGRGVAHDMLFVGWVGSMGLVKEGMPIWLVAM